jgi:hypothetical protein
MICAWTVEDFAGYVIDYGTFPEQPRRYFQLRQASPTLASAFPGLPIEDVIRRGLETLVPDLLSRKMPRGETVVTIDRLLIDQGYKPDTVHRFIQGSTHKTIITPAKGVGIGAGGRPISEYVRKTGELYGTHWMIPIPAGRELRHIKHDTNSWKTFIHERLALNDKGALRLYGNKSGEHRLLADHFTAEIPIPTEGQGRRLNEWKIKPSRPDNHFFDDAIGCAVAASYCGCGKAPAPPAAPPRRRMANRFTYL